jgi:hypothetical protein
MASTFILATGSIQQGGEIEWRIAPLPVSDEPQDGELLAMIDYAAEVEEYQDYLADLDFWRSGGW